MKTEKWEVKVIEACNATRYRQITPDVVPCCEECQSLFGMTEQEITQHPPTDEGGYYFHSCDVCGGIKEGERFAAHGYSKEGKLIHYFICMNCRDYLLDGTLPQFD